MAIETTMDSLPPTKTFAEQYGDDIGSNKVIKAVSTVGGVVGGAVLGRFLGNTHGIQTGNPLAMILGGAIGGVVAYKVVPEIATDVQRANQAVDQQVANGKSEGNLADRFKAIGSNILNFNGQSVVPTMDDSIDV